MPEQGIREFVLGGSKTRRESIGFTSDSYYFPPDSLQKLLSALYSQGYLLKDISFSFDYNDDANLSSPDSMFRQFFGFSPSEKKYYISQLKIRGVKYPYLVRTPQYLFDLELMNYLRTDSVRRCIAGGSDRWHHYTCSWAEVHVKIKAQETQSIEDIVKPLILPHQFQSDEWKDE